jgi:hypothetical protein
MNPWETILLALGGNAAFLAVLGWLGKSLLERLIVRDTKRFEADLRAKSDAAIEHLKNELQLKTIEHEIRFSRLHEKRAEVIAELYGHLVEALWEAESFVSPIEWAGELSKKEKYIRARNQLVDLNQYLGKHMIYLPQEVCTSLGELISEVHIQIETYDTYVRLDQATLDHDANMERREKLTSGWNAIKKEVPRARRSLENEFRLLLGSAANQRQLMTSKDAGRD